LSNEHNTCYIYLRGANRQFMLKQVYVAAWVVMQCLAKE
jgi:hypothetical protein